MCLISAKLVGTKVHQMSSRYWVTYRNDNRQYIANTKIQGQHLSEPPHPLRNQHQLVNSKTGRSSTCKCISSAKYFMKWTSSSLCTCSQTTTSGTKTQRFVSLEKSPAPTQWKDFCDQTPIDKARHSVPIFHLL